MADIGCIAKQVPRPTFFTGYDCDSLALEGITGFVDSFLDCFATPPPGPLRTAHQKYSAQTHTPTKAPGQCRLRLQPDPKRGSRPLRLWRPPRSSAGLEAMVRLQQKGWPLGLRFDPLIWHQGYQAHYRQLFETAFAALDSKKIHSVSLGQFRLPKATFKNIQPALPRRAPLCPRPRPATGHGPPTAAISPPRCTIFAQGNC